MVTIDDENLAWLKFGEFGEFAYRISGKFDEFPLIDETKFDELQHKVLKRL